MAGSLMLKFLPEPLFPKPIAPLLKSTERVIGLLLNDHFIAEAPFTKFILELFYNTLQLKPERDPDWEHKLFHCASKNFLQSSQTIIYQAHILDIKKIALFIDFQV